MRWEYGGSPGWLEAETLAGWFVVAESASGFWAGWLPTGADSRVGIGTYRTQAAAKGACKRYAKKMAAAFKAMGKAGWQ
jgi:hypothetical protein